MTRPKTRDLLPCLVLLVAVLAAYANHFQNTFHFDDFHTTVDNRFVHDPRNIPRFFTNQALSSENPEDATYRPVTAASLTIDYWLGKGRPFWFHLSTFLWFEVQLVLMFFLFRRIMDRAGPHPLNYWTALAAVACYGLHPVCAETVNYIVQRADLYNTLGVVASLLWFIAYPAQRKRGWYLLPAVLACLAKAPALIFPLILLAWLFLFEQDADRKNWGAAIRGALPAIVAGVTLAILTAKMTPATFDSGARSGALYRLTQPWVALHYFVSFFLPTGLSADTDWTYVSGPFSLAAMAGYLFVAALAAATVYTARKPETRPIAFGIVWFAVTLLPTSLMPLAEVTNDHRMFFPFVGLVLAVFWGLRLLVLYGKVPVRVAAGTLAVVFLAEAAGTWQRNEVWRTEESLWRDVALKSPKNGRGLMNYGTTFVARGDYATALDYLQRAQALMPDYPQIELNMAITYGTMERPAEAEEHFRRAIAMAGRERPDLHYYYGVWLRHWGRTAEAQAELERTIRGNPYSFNARDVLMQIYSEQHEWQALDAMFQDSLRMAYDEDTVRRFRDARAAFEKEQEARRTASPAAAPGPSPAALARQAAEACHAGKFEDCLSTSLKAIELKPDYAEAYNNKAYALIGLQRPDEAINAWREAVRLKPDYTIAKNNLARALEEKRKAESAGR